MKLLIKENNSEKEVIDFNEIKACLNKHKIYVDQIELDDNNNFKQDHQEFVEQFKQSQNYISSDEVNLKPETPQAILDPFKKIHHHTDDEIRFTIEGEGIFGIVPNDSLEIEIFCSKGDLISIPAYTRHWFKLTDKHTMQCVRIFKENPKWEAIY